MRIVLATDSFKGSVGSLEAARAMARGIKRVLPNCSTVEVPVADGGEGTVEALVEGRGGKVITKTVTGPLGEPVDARYGLLTDGTAIIEMASASGLPLVLNEKRDPKITTTRGTGDLILDALNRGSRNFVLGIGGSATNDGGTGMAAALGYRFLDQKGNELPPGGGGLAKLTSIDWSNADRRLRESVISVACDVNNPLFGPQGASAVYGPQKGASPEDVRLLDENLRRLDQIVSGGGLSGPDTPGNGAAEKRGEGTADIPAEIPGAGAAGGLGYGLMIFCGARLRSGIEIVLDTLKFDETIAGANLIITGEGMIDGQSLYGKVPIGIAARAAKQQIPTVALVGGIGKGASEVYKHHIASIMSIVPMPMSLEDAMQNGEKLLQDSAERLMRMVLVGKKL